MQGKPERKPPQISELTKASFAPWKFRWDESRQPTTHPKAEDYLAHAYTALEPAFMQAKEFLIRLCPDLKIETTTRVATAKDESGFTLVKTVSPLKAISVDRVGPNALKSASRVQEKIDEIELDKESKKEKDVTNIGDYGRFRYIVPMGGRQKFLEIRKAIKNICLSESTDTNGFSDFKDRLQRPSIEGYRDFKAHMKVDAPSFFRRIENIDIPVDFFDFYADEFNNAAQAQGQVDQAQEINVKALPLRNEFFANEGVTFEIQIIPEEMLIAEKLTARIREYERSVDKSCRKNLFGHFMRSLTNDLGNYPEVMSALRRNINNLAAERGGYNEDVSPEFINLTELERVPFDKSPTAQERIDSMLKDEKNELSAEEKALLRDALNYKQKKPNAPQSKPTRRYK